MRRKNMSEIKKKGRKRRKARPRRRKVEVTGLGRRTFYVSTDKRP